MKVKNIGGFFILAMYMQVSGQIRPEADKPWRTKAMLNMAALQTPDSMSSSKIIYKKSDIPLRQGWPQRVSLWPQFPVTSDLDGDGIKEIIVADRNGMIYVFRENGEIYSRFWPKRIGTDLSSPAVADINNDGLPEIIAIERINLLSTYFPNGRVHVLRPDGSELPGWPIMTEGSLDWMNTVCLADITNDGFLNIIVATGESYRHFSDPIIYYNSIYAFNYDGTLVDGWPVEPDSASGVNRGPRSPLIAVDLDNDGDREILSGFLSREHPNERENAIYALESDGSVMEGYFPIITTEWNYALAVADMNGDGVYEIYTHGTKFKNNGFADNDWDKQRVAFSRLAFADVNQDGLPELIYGSAGGAFVPKIHVVDKDGKSLPGWPLYTDEEDIIDGNPVAGDIDGDDDIEILITSYRTNNIFAWHHDGTPVNGFPIVINSSSSRIAISDLDGDGSVELIAAAEDSMIYVWDIPSTGPCTNLEWPMFQHDERHTGVYPSSYTNAVADRPVSTPVYFTLQQNYPNPFNSETRIPYTLTARANVTLSIIDLRGRTVALLEQGVRNAGRHEAVWNAAGFSSGVYLAQLKAGDGVRTRKIVLTR
ncbi:T9SS type A sorting domain-containing protein [bacterium]|nr:T9SS type A sorting domain-containing protein [bacterium]